MNNQKINILFVDHTPFIGGAQLALVRHLKCLDLSVFQPYVACSGASSILVEMLKNAGAEVTIIPFGKLKSFNPLVLLNYLITVHRLSVLIKKHGIDLIAANTERAGYSSAVAARLSKKKLIWIIRDFEYSKFLLGIVSKYVSVFISVSLAIKKYYLGDSEDERWRVIYVGSDITAGLEEVLDPEIKERRRNWSVGDGDFVIGYIGRLVGWKGVQVILAAGKRLKDLRFETGGWKIVVIGEASGQEGDITEELKKMVLEFGLAAEVVFMGFRRDIPLCLKSFDFLVHPSIRPEPFATVIVEAMMAGLPVIASNLGGTPEIIEDGKNGLLFPAGDAEALALTLIRLMRDFKLRESLKNNAREKAQKDFSEENISAKLQSIYLSCRT